MSVLQSIFLGAVQGVAEFLPISSSGHLTILENLFEMQTANSVLFQVLLHCGTLAALFMVLSRDILRMLVESVRMAADIAANVRIRIHNQKEQDAIRRRKIVHNNYRKLVVLLLVSLVPTAVIGYASRELVQLAQETLIVPGVCMVLTAFFLIVADVSENGKKIPKDVSYTNAFLIGVVQGLAVLPGLSGPGLVASVCLMSGFDKKFAVRYAFLLSIPTVFGALLAELGGLGADAAAASQAGCYFAGTATAALVGCLCARRLLALVKRKKFKGFAVYCLIVGALAIAAYIARR